MNSNVSHWLKVVSGLFLLACLLPGTAAAKSTPVKLSVEYVYAPDGMLAGRTVNGQVQRFEYDKRGQLLAVKDVAGKDLERYTYDSAGNILSKTVHGKTTRFTYDAANQITSRTNPDGSVVQYRYDAAGRLVQEGTRSYVYGYQDKVEEIRENGKTVARFSYGLDGQLETVMRTDGSVEHFHWDGLALIGRGKSTFINEPYVTGGNPIASDGKAMLNDMLGSTVGIRDGEKMTPVSMTAFGESTDQGAMYTGKPHVDGLGYAFLFRNYRADKGKWLSADPLGYPDGWNNLAYCNNIVTFCIDFEGMTVYYLLAPNAVGGFGHAAAIYDMGNGVFRITDFGGYKDNYTATSLQEAFNILQEKRPANEKLNSSAVVYNMSDSDTQLAWQTTRASVNRGYSPLGNNCSQVISDGINAAGGYLARSILPNNAIPDTVQQTPFLTNLKYRYTLVNNILE